MARVALVHWNDPQIDARVAGLERAGHAVEVLSPDGGKDLSTIVASPPDAFVLDLDRSPSRGAAVGTYVRQRKATRRVPLVLAGGDAEKVSGVRAVLPDATFCTWRDLARALRRALAASPAVAPVVPGTMDGYSGTPLPKKLGIGPGSTVLLLGAPKGFEATIGTVPGGARVTRRAATGTVLLLFAESRAGLAKRFPRALEALAERGRLWIAWPKKASGIPTDLAQDEVRAFGLARDLVDFKICAIDATWSALCFTRRRRKS